MAREWIAFFSQTGSEIVSLGNALGKMPTEIVYNEKPIYKNDINQNIDKYTLLPNRPTVEDYERILSKYDNPLVTLHGWLRIVPPEICSKYEIFNGHPGLIDEYPELKGKDPQEKAYRLGLQEGGSVIHRVTEGVDEGEILYSTKASLKGLDLNGVYNILRETSMVSWMKFFTKVFYEEGYCSSWEFEYWKEYDLRTTEDEVN
jgi:folate-dependent phosphoribosylglycinamide formyltransferase PurN